MCRELNDLTYTLFLTISEQGTWLAQGGAVIYAMRFPECLKPGHFDYLFNSHQLFHLAVVIAAVFHYRASLVSTMCMPYNLQRNTVATTCILADTVHVLGNVHLYGSRMCVMTFQTGKLLCRPWCTGATPLAAALHLMWASQQPSSMPARDCRVVLTAE